MWTSSRWTRGSVSREIAEAPARAAVARALMLDPSSSDAYVARGVLRLMLGKLADSEADHLRAIELNPNNLRALQEYGRLAKTLHILRWYANKTDRRRVLRQLNKGEALHDLRAYLMVANKGQLRRKRGEELANQASCLNLVTNAVILWNTVYMAAAVEQLNPRRHAGSQAR